MYSMKLSCNDIKGTGRWSCMSVVRMLMLHLNLPLYWLGSGLFLESDALNKGASHSCFPKNCPQRRISSLCFTSPKSLFTYTFAFSEFSLTPSLSNNPPSLCHTHIHTHTTFCLPLWGERVSIVSLVKAPVFTEACEEDLAAPFLNISFFFCPDFILSPSWHSPSPP